MLVDDGIVTAIDEDAAEEEQRAVNPSLFAVSAAAQAIIQDAAALVLEHELGTGKRTNKRRPADQDNFDKIIDALLSSLMHDHLLGNEGGLFISRSNRARALPARYRSRLHSKMLPTLLDALASPQVRLIEQDVARAYQGSGRATVIRPAAELCHRLENADLQLADFDLRPEGETIILKRVKDQTDFWDEGGLEDYADTSVTQAFRDDVQSINDWLVNAKLGCIEAGVSPNTGVDTRNRRLRRIFTQGRFDSGGRLFGGFWQEMKKAGRRELLIIEGDEAVELDYGQAGARILYGMAGHQPPAQDLYETRRYPGRRDGIKRVMGAMMFATKRLDRMPKGTRKLFHHSDTVAEVTRAIEKHHPLLVDHFHRGLGHEVQFIESQIMMRVMTTMMASGLVALPIHDAVMVAHSRVDEAQQIMLQAFREVAGVDGVVTIEGKE